MISIKVDIPNKLKIRLSKYNTDITIGQFINKVGDDALLNVREYGEGGGNPSGGAPYWQGKVTQKGHYRGYLSSSHYIKRISNNHIQIVSSAGFAEGVIIGQSTNWTTRDGGAYVFAPNPYHKRAVDKLYESGSIQTNWRRVIKGSIV